MCFSFFQLGVLPLGGGEIRRGADFRQLIKGLRVHSHHCILCYRMGQPDADRSSSLCSTRINENGSPTVDGSCRFPYHPEPDQDSIDNKCFKRFRLNLFYHLPEIDTIEILNIF